MVLLLLILPIYFLSSLPETEVLEIVHKQAAQNALTVHVPVEIITVAMHAPNSAFSKNFTGIRTEKDHLPYLDSGLCHIFAIYNSADTHR